MTIGPSADAGVPMRASAAIEAAVKINLRIFPPARTMRNDGRELPSLVCQPHQYRQADAIAIAPLAGASVQHLLRRTINHAADKSRTGPLCPAAAAPSNRISLTQN